MDKLKEIISKYIDTPSQINEDMSLSKDLGIDSFSLISMVMEIEESYNIQIPDSELNQFKTLKDLYGYISSLQSA